MRKNYAEPTLEVIKFSMNETITTDESLDFNPTLSPGVENWD